MSDVQTHHVASGQGPLLRSSFGYTSRVISFGQDRLRSSFDPSEGVISLGQDAEPMSDVQTHHVASARVPFSGPPLTALGAPVRTAIQQLIGFGTN